MLHRYKSLSLTSMESKRSEGASNWPGSCQVKPFPVMWWLCWFWSCFWLLTAGSYCCSSQEAAQVLSPCTSHEAQTELLDLECWVILDIWEG